MAEEGRDPMDARGWDPRVPEEKEQLGHHLRLLDEGHGGTLFSTKDKKII